jgi:3-hydroxyacyl-CoA dehydrogenase
MREPTLQTIGLGSVSDIFRAGRLPVDAADLVDRVFGGPDERGSMVISGANGIVGAGKTMQLGSRLVDFDVPIVALDFPSAPDGIGRQYPGLVAAFGRQGADRIMGNIVRLNYDGGHLPSELKDFHPRFLLEAIPEILDVKKEHYKIFRNAFPDIAIRSVTSGFPSSELGVGVAHPAFPHEINKIWEIVEPEPSDITQLFWALGLIPVPVSDHWSFVLDVLFCGSVLAGLRYHRASNMPFWKIDKLTRKMLGPNPFRASDAIGAPGANFLIWSCLHHLSGTYGDLFRPTPELEEHKETGATWYPPNHFRPLVDWKLDADEQEEFRTWTLGPLFQMANLMVHEQRAHLSHINAIGELCAQFRSGILAVIRELGPEAAIAVVESYHDRHPGAAELGWFPEAFEGMEAPEWQQLYVNAEHDGRVGVVTISRESYNWDVDRELNRALDWLRTEAPVDPDGRGRHERLLPRAGKRGGGTPDLERVVPNRPAPSRGFRGLGGIRERQALPGGHAGAPPSLPVRRGRGGRVPRIPRGESARRAGHGGLSLAAPKGRVGALAQGSPPPAEWASGPGGRCRGLADRLLGTHGGCLEDGLAAGLGRRSRDSGALHRDRCP